MLLRSQRCQDQPCPGFIHAVVVRRTRGPKKGQGGLQVREVGSCFLDAQEWPGQAQEPRIPSSGPGLYTAPPLSCSPPLL